MVGLENRLAGAGEKLLDSDSGESKLVRLNVHNIAAEGIRLDL